MSNEGPEMTAASDFRWIVRKRMLPWRSDDVGCNFMICDPAMVRSRPLQVPPATVAGRLGVEVKRVGARWK